MTGSDSPSHRSYDTLVGGTWLPSPERIEVVDPSDGSICGSVASASIQECLAAVDAAEAASGAWASLPPRDRSQVLGRVADQLLARSDELATLISTESGKVRTEARSEVTYAADFFRWFAEEAVRVGGELRRAPRGDKYLMIRPQPVGVSLLITPWNFPIAMGARKIAAALAAGCTVVVKPAPEAPLGTFALAEILVQAGAPPGVVNVVVPEPPQEAVAAMVDRPAVRKLSFTGSTAVGQHLLALAARRVVRCSLELGGNAPFIVRPDADLDEAVEAATVAKLRNGGASCVAANSFVVHQQIVSEFTSRLATAMARYTVGSTHDPSSDVGPLITEAERSKVAGLVEDVVARGATVTTGGVMPGGTGFLYPPTVVTGVPPDDPILATEVFGPVAVATTYTDDDDAIELANRVGAGLMAYVMTRDLRVGLHMADRLETGMVALNRGVLSDAAAPFGGAKSSGLGREGGFEGIEEYLERKYVAVDW